MFWQEYLKHWFNANKTAIVPERTFSFMRKESLIFYLTYHTRKPTTGATLMTAKLFTKAQDFHFYFVFRFVKIIWCYRKYWCSPRVQSHYDYSKAMYFGRKLFLRGSFDRHPHPLFTISNFNFDLKLVDVTVKLVDS